VIRLAGILALLLAAAQGAPARKEPSVGYAFPAGGRRGTTFPMLAGGQGLRGVSGVLVSGEGVRATVVRHVMPLGRKQQGELRRRLMDAARVKRGGRPLERKADEEVIELPDHPMLKDLENLDDAGLRKVALRFLGAGEKQQPNAQIGETVEIEVVIDAGAAAGDRELRLLTPAGPTNPLRFQVGAAPESCEEEFSTAPVLDLPAVVNGQVMPGDADRIRFRARKGQKVVVDVRARRLIPYLADAVPGWFQAVAALYDAKGREVAFADDWRTGPDPVLLFDVPADGEYALEVRDALYRGREDFVWRASLGPGPFGPWMFPGIPGAGEAEPNDDAARAQALLLPRVLGGRIGKPGDVDVFRFEGHAGQEVVAEIEARRLGSPLDSVLTLADDAGAAVAWNDDHGDRGEGLLTHQADSWLRATLPADGTYRLTVIDAQRHGGPEYVYRLRVGPPRPGFEVFATPSGLGVPGGRAAPIRLHVVRRDGFEGDIEVALKDAPEGFILAGARIPAGKDSIRATLSVPPDAAKGPLVLRMEARAVVGGAEVLRPVVPAEDRMQAFLYRHLVPAQQMVVEVIGAGRLPASIVIESALPVRIPAGGTALVRVRVPAGPARRNLLLALDEPPPGFSLEGTTVVPGGLAFVLRADATVKSGAADNLIVEIFGDGDRRPSLGHLPAIPFVVE